MPTPPRAEAAPSSSALRPIAAATLGLAMITLGVRVLGFVEKQVLAYYFGAGAAVDAFFVAASVPMAFFLFVREVIEPAFLPLFVESLGNGREEVGWRLFRAATAGIAVITTVLVIATWWWAYTVASWLAPGFSAEVRATTAGLIRLVVPGGIFLGLSALTYITLNAYRRFALPALGDVVFRGASVVGGLLLAPRLGISALGLGILTGAAGRLAVHVAGLAGTLRRLGWPRGPGRDDLRRMLVLMAPLVVGVAVSQVNDLAGNYFASVTGEGGVAARNYARKIVDLPIVVLPYTLSVVLFPYFSHLAARGEWDALFTTFAEWLRGIAIVSAAISVALVMLAEPIVTLLLERGAFEARARFLTAWPLQLYALGLVTFALEALLVPLYYALKDTLTPVAVGILGVIAHIAFCALLVDGMGVGGVALALTLSKTLKLIVLGGLLERTRPGIAWRAVAGCGLRLALAAGVAAAAVHQLLAGRIAPDRHASIVAQVGFLAAPTLVAVSLLFATVALLGKPERALMRDCAAWTWRLVRRADEL